MTRTVAIALAVIAIAAGSASAGPPKVMVLPLDGNADAPTRAKFSASVQRLARMLDGKVTPGTTTFVDSAMVIGCDPAVPACADDVRATLGVDELVYGTITARDGQLVLVVRRTAKGKPAREISATLAVKDPPERAEPALLPLFHGGGTAVGAAVEPTPKEPVDTPPVPPAGTPPPTGDPEPSPIEPAPPAGEAPVDRPRTRRDRTLGIAAIAGGGTMLLIGLALWSSASNLQSQIDAETPDDRDDIDELIALEDRAVARAWIGNAMVLAGVALAAGGGWLLYRDHKARRVVVTPTAADGGAGLMLTVVGRL